MCSIKISIKAFMDLHFVMISNLSKLCKYLTRKTKKISKKLKSLWSKFFKYQFGLRKCFIEQQCLVALIELWKASLQSMKKIMGKTAIWTISYFYPLPPLNNVETQWAKRVSSYFIGSQHCIGEDRIFKHTFLNSHDIFS